MRKAALYNLGCKVNAYETEAMQEMLKSSGYEIVPFGGGADVYVINTCTVTNMADRKSRQILHRARKMNPEAVIVAAGCYVQARGPEADECIDIIIGNNRKKDLVEILEDYFRERDSAGEKGGSQVRAELLNIAETREYEKLRLSREESRTRANIKVQDGCNQFCSYCIIPYARGRARSRDRGDVVEEARRLAAGGYREVVLTGIHLSSYGADTGDSLLALIQSVHQVPGILRIRLGSLEPRIITESFAGELAALSKVCPHFHLSLQSGCNETLKRMNRRYTAEEYYEKCLLLREAFSDPALTTDVIVGFPGETEEEFQASRAFVEKVNFYDTHIFKYSRRQGTKAAGLPGQVPEQIKAARSSILMEIGKAAKRAYEEKLIGRTAEVLIEEQILKEGEVWQVGHTKEYVKVGLKCEENLTNQLINVEIENRLQIID